MKSGEFWELGHVGDRDLHSELMRLLANSSRTEARIIAHLAAVEERRLHLEVGTSSLFNYCCSRLGLSESEAFHRITAARLARRFPVIFSLIERRELHLTAVCLLRDYLTPENHQELLAEASGKSKLQVLELLARRLPRPDVASTVRKLPAPRAAGKERETLRDREPGSCAEPTPSQVDATEQPPSGRAAEAPTRPPFVAPPLGPPGAAPGSAAELHQGGGDARTEGEQTARGERAAIRASSTPRNAVGLVARGQVIVPVSADRYRIQLNASAQLKEKLTLAVDLLSHSNPTGDLATVIERALDVLIERVQKERFAQTKRRRGEPSDEPRQAKHKDFSDRSRRGHIPNATKRQIAARDGLHCTFVGADGRRCGETRFTQIHHEHAWARGGGDTVDNLRMLCAAHNRLLAERDFGKVHIDKRVEAHRARAANAEPTSHSRSAEPGFRFTRQKAGRKAPDS